MYISRLFWNSFAYMALYTIALNLHRLVLHILGEKEKDSMHFQQLVSSYLFDMHVNHMQYP